MFFRPLLASVLIVSASFCAGAQELQGVLKKIKETNVISMSTRESSIPFSYLDGKQEAVGYSVDLCMRVIDDIKRAIKAPNLEVRRVPVTSQSRIPLVANGTVDLECGSTTNSVERQKQVAFSKTFYVAAARIMVPRNGPIKAVSDLKGKSVATTTGGNTILHLQRLSDGGNLQLKLPQAKDHAEGWLLMETGRADAVANDDVLLYSLRANSKAPQDYVVLPVTLSTEPYGVMMQRDDPQLKKVVDDSLVAMFRSGEAEKIYNKWFMDPIPPRGVNLNLPLSDELRDAFRNPTDKGAQ
jgi:glutamate/aspartate transport system substrate-binding protein